MDRGPDLRSFRTPLSLSHVVGFVTPMLILVYLSPQEQERLALKTRFGAQPEENLWDQEPDIKARLASLLLIFLVFFLSLFSCIALLLITYFGILHIL